MLAHKRSCLCQYSAFCLGCSSTMTMGMHSLQHHRCWVLCVDTLGMLQIMLRLQAQDRPEIPELDTLPGQPLPGITQYIKLMKVSACHLWCRVLHWWSPSTVSADKYHRCRKTPSLSFWQVVCVNIFLSVMTASGCVPA